MLFALLLFSASVFADSTRVRKIEVTGDQIVSVRTAIGVATIVQVPDRPASLVVGDTEAFKIEYLDQAITIKPLRSNAKSNLYIYTDWKRFNVQLVTGPESSADYVVYLSSPSKKPDPDDLISWEDVSFNSKLEDLSLSVNRIGRLKGKFLFIGFSLTGKKSEVDPKWFWITQKSVTKPVHRLLLSTLSLNQDGPVDGLIQIRLKDVSKADGLTVELRRKNILVVKIPREIVWK